VHDAAGAVIARPPRQLAGELDLGAGDRRLVARRQRGGGAREHVAAVERRADVGGAEPLVLDHVRRLVAALGQVREHPVVGADVPPAARADQHVAPRAADPGVDDDDVDRVMRKLDRRVGDHPRGVRDVAGRDIVRDVHDHRHAMGADEPRDHALERADIAVRRTEIRGQCDDRHRSRR
jgi:hypothetical protein